MLHHVPASNGIDSARESVALGYLALDSMDTVELLCVIHEEQNTALVQRPQQPPREHLLVQRVLSAGVNDPLDAGTESVGHIDRWLGDEPLAEQAEQSQVRQDVGERVEIEAAFFGKVLEARVVAATRSFARDIGVQLGLGWGNGTTGVGGVQGVGTSPIVVGGGAVPNPLYPVVGTPSSGTQVPLFSNLGAVGPTSGLQFTNFSNNVRIDAILTMAESRGLLKVLSRPRIVTQNNIQAVVKQGVKIPIMTAPSLGAPATATYVDAFLRLTVTPQITSEGTIFLNVDVENTLPNFGQVDSEGNPELITQQATTQVLVTDGGTVVIGGVIQTQNSLSVAQVPLLGDIPYLGNLFKRRTVTTSNQELIFFITPRIIQT